MVKVRDIGSLRVSVLGGDVWTPAAPWGDFKMAFTEPGFAQDAEDFGVVGKGDAANTQARGFLEKDADQAVGGNLPDFEEDPSAILRIAHHSGMAIVDGPEAVVGTGVGFPDKGGTCIGKV